MDVTLNSWRRCLAPCNQALLNEFIRRVGASDDIAPVLKYKKAKAKIDWLLDQPGILDFLKQQADAGRIAAPAGWNPAPDIASTHQRLKYWSRGHSIERTAPGSTWYRCGKHYLQVPLDEVKEMLSQNLVRGSIDNFKTGGR